MYIKGGEQVMENLVYEITKLISEEKEKAETK